MHILDFENKKRKGKPARTGALTTSGRRARDVAMAAALALVWSTPSGADIVVSPPGATPTAPAPVTPSDDQKGLVGDAICVQQVDDLIEGLTISGQVAEGAGLAAELAAQALPEGANQVAEGIALGTQIVAFGFYEGVFGIEQFMQDNDYPECDTTFAGTVTVTAGGFNVTGDSIISGNLGVTGDVLVGGSFSADELHAARGISAHDGAIWLGNPDGESYFTGITLGGGALAGAGTGGDPAYTGDLTSIAIGNGSSATGVGGIAFGDGAKTDTGVSIGFGAGEEGDAGVAVGVNSRAREATDTAVGNNSSVNAANGTAYGANTFIGSLSDNGVAIGENTTIGAADVFGSDNVTAVGRNIDIADGVDNVVAIGTEASVTADGGIAIGVGVTTDGASAVGIGIGADADGLASVAVGFGSNATGDFSTATGNASVANNLFATAYGSSSIAVGTFSTASGALAVAADDRATATGALAVAAGENSTATGAFAVAGGLASTATGYLAVAAGDFSTATGFGAIAAGDGSIANGSGAVATGPGSIATGSGAAASGPDSIATGTNATAEGANAMAYGTGATTGTNVNSVAFGAGAMTTFDNQQVFGTANETYTMPGITSQLSRSRQSGLLELPTTDSLGNLASDGGLVFQVISNLRAGMAASVAIAPPSLTDSEEFGINFAWGNYNGVANGMGFSAIGVIDRNLFNGKNRLALTAGAGVGFSEFFGYDGSGTATGRAGFQLTW